MIIGLSNGRTVSGGTGSHLYYPAPVNNPPQHTYTGVTTSQSSAPSIPEFLGIAWYYWLAVILIAGVIIYVIA